MVKAGDEMGRPPVEVVFTLVVAQPAVIEIEASIVVFPAWGRKKRM